MAKVRGTFIASFINDMILAPYLHTKKNLSLSQRKVSHVLKKRNGKHKTLHLIKFAKYKFSQQ